MLTPKEHAGEVFELRQTVKTTLSEVVTFRPADRALLLPDASVSIFAPHIDGVYTALSIDAGRSGFQLPS